MTAPVSPMYRPTSAGACSQLLVGELRDARVVAQRLLVARATQIRGVARLPAQQRPAAEGERDEEGDGGKEDDFHEQTDCKTRAEPEVLRFIRRACDLTLMKV